VDVDFLSLGLLAMRNVGEGLKETPVVTAAGFRVFVAMFMVWSVCESAGVGPWWSQFEL